MEIATDGIPRFRTEFRNYCSMRVVLSGQTFNLVVTDAGRVFILNIKRMKWEPAEAGFVSRTLLLCETMQKSIAKAYMKEG